MDKIKEIINKLLGRPSGSDSSDSKGFTLVELLIVIAVIGILAAALLAAIDPIDKIKQGRDTKVVNDVRAIYDGANRVYTNYGTWPNNGTGTGAEMIADIATKGELKTNPTNPSPSGVYSMVTDVNNVVVWGTIDSKVNKCKALATCSTAPAAAYFVLTPTGGCYSVNPPTINTRASATVTTTVCTTL